MCVCVCVCVRERERGVYMCVVCVQMDSSLNPPSPTSVYLALRANDQLRRFINIHLHYIYITLYYIYAIKALFCFNFELLGVQHLVLTVCDLFLEQ